MDTLLTDLFKAYYDARQNKRNTPSQLRFEMDLETNLINLYHELKDRRYKPLPSVCFIVKDSVKREVFASHFRDRVVHHLYYNYVSQLFDHQFIYDSYSCRKGKGTLMGIERLQKHVRSVSRNYTHKAYILKMDIQGYFMSINREKLCALVHEMTTRVKMNSAIRSLVDYLTDIFTLKDPLQGAKFKGNLSEWEELPTSKCLSCSPTGVGLPIGDLTSQLFSNIFLNKLDWFVTTNLGFKYYGRYVDDFYILDENSSRLEAAVPKISTILASLGLKLHPRKTKIQSTSEAVQFLGAVIYPHYIHCSSRTMRKYITHKTAYMWLREKFNNCYNSADAYRQISIPRCLSSMTSYFGYLRHFKSLTQLLPLSL